MTNTEILQNKLKEAKDFAKASNLEMFAMIIECVDDEIGVDILATGDKDNILQSLGMCFKALQEDNSI